jgi:hypothetical protein
MADDDTPPAPPKSCPICSVAMQTTENDKRLIHECHNCGMTITFALPNAMEAWAGRRPS